MTAAAPTLRPRRGDAVIRQALEILERRLRRPGAPLSTQRAVRDYLRLRLAEMEREAFIVLYLDAQNRLLAFVPLFYGTLTQTSVHPREVVKMAMAYNAASVLLAHNHPSGVCEPSRADEMMTQVLKSALALVDVKLLDHFIVAGAAEPMSFAAKGLL
jgi:DNA repair protein RadC